MSADDHEAPRASLEARPPGPVVGEAVDDPRHGEPWTGSPARSTKASSVGAFFRELPVLIVVAFVLAFLLRTFVVQVFYIPSASMEPTLLVDDRILVEKVSYRFRDLRRGEIVVFEGEQLPEPSGPNNAVTRALRSFGQLVGVAPVSARDYVKRVIGLPGDEVVIEDGRVSVNGVELDEPYAVEDPRSCAPIVVPEGKLFFLGDNRPNSSDSRYPSLGFVDVDAVVGRAFLIIWPFERLEVLDTPAFADIPDADGAAPPPAEVPAAGPCAG